MHAVVRMYAGKGTKELFDVLEKHKPDIEKQLRGIKGLASFTLVRGGEGGFSVTVCEDKVGADESVKAAREWIAKHAASAGAAAPKVSEGPVIMHVKV